MAPRGKKIVPPPLPNSLSAPASAPSIRPINANTTSKRESAKPWLLPTAQASPRATIFLTVAAKAWALLQGREYVTPEDIKSIGPDVLRHRIILTYEAEAQAVTTDGIIKKIFNAVPIP